ncbi:hypothetical protein [Amphibacillus sediminis]|uniref:hypothetical protein n=1 Tax=Amphibacillus sediminis TaxID=360185 RepID=UPI0008355E9A|nr:hypothetical protein [Amphibacillus sediminis]
MKLKSYEVLSVRQKQFSELSLDDSFFDSLKEDYPGFENWFLRKSKETAFIVENKGIQGFLYMKIEGEDEDYSKFTVPLEPKKRLKIGTFKITMKGHYLGERFFRIILEHAIMNRVEEVYVTIFSKRDEQKLLINFMRDFGFRLQTTDKKTNEQVFVREMEKIITSETSLKNYPYIEESTKRKYFMLSIDTIYHTKLIPDSIIREENPKDFTSNIVAANAIQKTYIGNYMISPRPGDIIVYYRTKPSFDERPAKYSAVLTGFGVVSDNHKGVHSYDRVIEIVSKRTVLTDKEIKEKLKTKRRVNILKFIDIYSFKYRPIRKFLLEQNILKSVTDYPTKEISSEEFDMILKQARFNKNNIFIN